MSLKVHTRFFVSTACLFLLAGCIPIENLGEYWAKGTIDPALEGNWRKVGTEHRSQDQFETFERSGDVYLWTTTQAMEQPGTPKPQFHCKTLTIGKQSYLMVGDLNQLYEGVKIPSAERPPIGGVLLRYHANDSMLTIYQLKESVLAKAIKEGNVAGRLPEEKDDGKIDFTPPALSRLDEKTMTFITLLADKPENWQEPQRYEKVPDLAKAIEVSKTYPAAADTAANTLVTVHLPDLKYFAEGREDILRRQLQASPDWRVFNQRGQIIAYERQNRVVSLNGFYSKPHPERIQTWKMFHFTDKIEGGRKDLFLRASPMEGEVHLRLRSSDQGIESVLAVGEGSLWFEFFEQSEAEPRTQTREALAWLEKFLKDVRANEEEIKKRGYAAKLLATDAIHHGAPELHFSDGIQGGIYDAHAWVNPGKPGQAYLKAFNVETGARLSEDRMTPVSNELIGWSTDASELFYYNTEIVVYEGDWEHFYDARFELWFKPDDGSPEKKLVETTRRICGWER